MSDWGCKETGECGGVGRIGEGKVKGRWCLRNDE